MAKVKFTQDYRGHLTDENYYTAGTVASFAEGPAAALVEAGRAVAVGPVAAQETQGGPIAPEPLPSMPTDWTRIKGVSTEIAAALYHLGLNTPAELLAFATMTGGDLTNIPGIGKKRAADIVEWAEDQL